MHHAVLVFLCICISANRIFAQFSNVGAASCAQILQAGIYNTFSSSSGQSGYSMFQSTMCSDLSGYSYDEYSQQSQSGQASSEAVDVNAAASYFGIGGSVGVDTSSSHLSESQFDTFKSKQSAYRQTACASSSSSSAFNNAVNSVSSVIDPSVAASYTSCLKIYATGIQITQTTGIDSRSLALDIQFVTNNLGAKAYMNGLSFNGPATCKLKGFLLPKGAATSFHFKLIVDAVYTVFCQLPSSVAANGGITDIYLSTTPGGTYHALLFHSAPASRLAQIESQVAAATQQISAANQQISTLTTQVASLSAEVAMVTTATKQDYVTLGPASYIRSSAFNYPGGTVSMSWPDATYGFSYFTPDVTTSIYGYTVPYEGSLVGISGSTAVDALATETGGTYTVHVFINGAQLTQSVDFAVMHDTEGGPQQPSTGSCTWSEGTYPFNAGDVISVSLDLSYMPVQVVSFVWLTVGYAH